MEQPKIERVLRLMKMMTGNTNYTVEDMAESLGVSYRTIYRYIETFKDSMLVSTHRVHKGRPSCIVVKCSVVFFC